MRIFDKGSGLKIVSSSLRFANDSVQEAGQEIGKALTATIEQDDSEQMLLNEMISEERQHYMRLPERKKRQILQKILDAKEKDAGKNTLQTERVSTARKNPVITYQRKIRESAERKKKPRRAVSSARVNERGRYRQVRSNIQTSHDGVRLEGGSIGELGTASGKRVVQEKGGRAVENFSANAKTAAKEGTKKGTSAISSVATAGVTTVVIETMDAAKKKAKQAAEKIRTAMEESRWEKEQVTSSLTGAEKKKKRKTEQEETYAPSGWLALGIGILLLLVMIVMLFAISTGDTTNPDFTSDESGAQLLVEVAQNELAQSDDNIGGTKYKEWYGMNANWCAMFVSYCSDQCGYVESGVMPKTASVSNMKKWYSDRNLFHPSTTSYQPKPGDVIIFGNGRSHTGIVISYDVENGIITTIEGNAGSSSTDPYHAGSRVVQNTYLKTNLHIMGYCTPEYPAPEEETETEQPSEEEEGT